MKNTKTKDNIFFITFKKDNKQILITWSLILLLIVIPLASIAFISWTYLVGFMIGSLSIFMMWLFNYVWSFFLLNLRNGIRSKNKRKKILLFLITKFLLVWSLFVGILIGTLFLNHHISKISWIDGFSNVFTFIAGASTIVFAYFINFIFENKKERIKKGFNINDINRK